MYKSTLFLSAIRSFPPGALWSPLHCGYLPTTSIIQLDVLPWRRQGASKSFHTVLHPPPGFVIIHGEFVSCSAAIVPILGLVSTSLCVVWWVAGKNVLLCILGVRKNKGKSWAVVLLGDYIHSFPHCCHVTVRAMTTTTRRPQLMGQRSTWELEHSFEFSIMLTNLSSR